MITNREKFEEQLVIVREINELLRGLQWNVDDIAIGHAKEEDLKTMYEKFEELYSFVDRVCTDSVNRSYR